MKATQWAYEQAAKRINAEAAAVKAVFEVEAAGRFFNSDGSIVRRFEPHHFPREHWHAIGFSPAVGQAPWRASLKVSVKRRAQMFEAAKKIDRDAAFEASSWGAPQIMGFNYKDAGFSSAEGMVNAMYDPAGQVDAFVTLVSSWGLDSAIRSHDWHTFAARYNGPGKAADYAGKIERAYRRASGSSGSSVILRVGAKGSAVAELQELLNALGAGLLIDGAFGPETRDEVIAAQADLGLVADGVVGAMTWKALRGAVGHEDATLGDRSEHVVPVQKTDVDRILDRAKGWGTAIVAGGGATQALSIVQDNATVIIVGVVVLALAFLAWKQWGDDS